jgi:hypothetical protein
MASKPIGLHNMLLSNASNAKFNYKQIIDVGRNFFLDSFVLGKYKVLLCNKVAGDAGRLRVNAIAVNNVQSNVATGTA